MAALLYGRASALMPRRCGLLRCFDCRAFATMASAASIARSPSRSTGVIKSIDFVNPHSYLNLDVVGADGKAIAMRCEMRAATLLRRSGWSEEMFVAGAQAKIFGFGHRDDPASCYLEDITIGDAPKRNRNDQIRAHDLRRYCRAGRGAGRRASRTSRAIGRRSST